MASGRSVGPWGPAVAVDDGGSEVDEFAVVVCVHGGGFSRAEQTLLKGGHGSTMIQQRIEIQRRMRDRFQAVIERATGRRVAFVSANQDDPR